MYLRGILQVSREKVIEVSHTGRAKLRVASSFPWEEWEAWRQGQGSRVEKRVIFSLEIYTSWEDQISVKLGEISKQAWSGFYYG